MRREAGKDNELVEQFQRGDRDAFEAFVRRHQDRICRLAAVSLMSPSQAPDVAQEVFLRAFTGLKRFRFGAQPFTWLYRTTKNVCKEYNRKQRELPDSGREPATLPAIDDALDMERCATEVRRLVSRLPERQRDVVLLRIFEELSVEQTATALRCRPGTVKALLHKAKATLRQQSAAGALGGNTE